MKDRKVIMPDKWALIRNRKTKELEFKLQLAARPKSDGTKGFPIYSFRIS